MRLQALVILCALFSLGFGMNHGWPGGYVPHGSSSYPPSQAPPLDAAHQIPGQGGHSLQFRDPAQPSSWDTSHVNRNGIRTFVRDLTTFWTIQLPTPEGTKWVWWNGKHWQEFPENVPGKSDKFNQSLKEIREELKVEDQAIRASSAEHNLQPDVDTYPAGEWRAQQAETTQQEQAGQAPIGPTQEQTTDAEPALDGKFKFQINEEMSIWVKPEHIKAEAASKWEWVWWDPQISHWRSLTNPGEVLQKLKQPLKEVHLRLQDIDAEWWAL
jgi:hypothetical protein